MGGIPGKKMQTISRNIPGGFTEGIREDPVENLWEQSLGRLVEGMPRKFPKLIWEVQEDSQEMLEKSRMKYQRNPRENLQKKKIPNRIPGIPNGIPERIPE